MISDIAGFAYDCQNADALSNFYVKLLVLYPVRNNSLRL